MYGWQKPTDMAYQSCFVCLVCYALDKMFFKQRCFARASSAKAPGTACCPPQAFTAAHSARLGGGRRGEPTVDDKLRSVENRERCGRAVSQQSVRGGIKTARISSCPHACDERFHRALLLQVSASGGPRASRGKCDSFWGDGGRGVCRSCQFY